MARPRRRVGMRMRDLGAVGVQYMRVARAAMRMMLARMTKDESVLRTKAPAAPAQVVKVAPEVKVDPKPIEKAKSKAPKREKKPKTVEKANPSKAKSSRPSGWRDITNEVRDLVATVSGVDAGELELDADMADFGIDSLMGMELGKEVDSASKCTLDQNEQMEATTLRKLVQCVSNALYDPNQGADEEAVEEKNDDSSSEELSESDEYSAESSDTGILTPIPEEEPSHPLPSRLALTSSDVLASFGQVKLNTDTLMKEYGVDKTEGVMLSGSNRLCAALVVEAMDELGSPLRTASSG
ncbi:hypothetical protein BDW74DRAFT_182871 [Aspergillus multicolor]|uniref:uncharacterized protein n=1 Tax=Aspergillus multicolor TaxID=41759 RepID=UPI003CCD55C2